MSGRRIAATTCLVAHVHAGSTPATRTNFRNCWAAVAWDDGKDQDEAGLRPIWGRATSGPAGNADRWENPTLDHVLEAMEACIEGMESYDRNTGQSPADPPTWKTFGDVLMPATKYESGTQRQPVWMEAIVHREKVLDFSE